jgi:hypothetical protein
MGTISGQSNGITPGVQGTSDTGFVPGVLATNGADSGTGTALSVQGASQFSGGDVYITGVNLAVTGGDTGKGGNATVSGNLVLKGNATVSGTVTVESNGDVILNDFAEHFDLADVEAEPGTVMTIDRDGNLRPSDRPYDKRVAGVVSGAGNYRPAIVLGKHERSDSGAAIALVGRVYCKVDADFAPIDVGDLLTTSERPGYAMKAADQVRAFGTTIGKALGTQASGQGMIPILVALQ